MKKNKIIASIIGAGRWGPNILGALNQISEVEVRFMCDLDKESLNRIQTKYPNLQTTSKIDDILTDPEVNMVCVATPVKTHFSLAKKVLESGKHLFVEKPLCPSVEECSQLLQIAKSKNLKLMVGHVFLFNPTIQKVKEIIDKGELGRIYYIETHRTNLGPVREDVNAIWDLTSHDISIFNYLLNGLPKRVSATGCKALDKNVEDTTFTSLEYPGGVLAHAHASWLNPLKVRQMTIVGEKKMLIWDDIDLNKPIQIFDSSITLNQNNISDSFTSHRLEYHRGDVLIPAVKMGEPLKMEMECFIQAIISDTAHLSDGIFSTEVVKALEASDRSLKNKSEFIEI
jgi:predicted dehydrogenase